MLEFEKISEKSLPDIEKIYISSFPEKERFPMKKLIEKSNSPRIDFKCASHNGETIGFYYAMRTGKIAFLLYLAVAEECRSKGYGKEIVERIANEYGRPVAVNVGMDNPSEKKIRAFYARNGFEDTGLVQKDSQGLFEVFCKGKFDLGEYGNLMKKFGFSDFVLVKK